MYSFQALFICLSIVYCVLSEWYSILNICLYVLVQCKLTKSCAFLACVLSVQYTICLKSCAVSASVLSTDAVWCRLNQVCRRVPKHELNIFISGEIKLSTPKILPINPRNIKTNQVGFYWLPVIEKKMRNLFRLKLAKIGMM